MAISIHPAEPCTRRENTEPSSWHLPHYSTEPFFAETTLLKPCKPTTQGDEGSILCMRFISQWWHQKLPLIIQNNMKSWVHKAHGVNTWYQMNIQQIIAIIAVVLSDGQNGFFTIFRGPVIKKDNKIKFIQPNGWAAHTISSSFSVCHDSEYTLRSHPVLDMLWIILTASVC